VFNCLLHHSTLDPTEMINSSPHSIEKSAVSQPQNKKEYILIKVNLNNWLKGVKKTGQATTC